MRRAAIQGVRGSDPVVTGVELSRAKLLQLRSTLRHLLAQRPGVDARHWRQSVLRDLRVLTDADKAVLVVRTEAGPLSYGDEVGQELLASYVNRFADLDRSRIAVRDHGLEVWSLSQLWPPGELERSRYYLSFAVPNHLHATLGVTFELPGLRADVSILLHRKWREQPAITEHRRELLALVFEPIRAGFELSLMAERPSPNLSSVIEVTGQALALFGLDGRELARNPVMRRILAQDQEAAGLQDHIREVAMSVLAQAGAAGGTPVSTATKGDGTRREVATSQAAYRLRGNLVGRDSLGHGTAVLVSLDRVAFQVPAPDSVRARYGLTLRELQVASLLMHRLSNVEIARMLGISPHTARHHTENVLAKFGVRSREALRRAVTEGPAA